MIDRDLVAASASPLVLSILAQEESYGYAIIKRVRELSGGELEWSEGMLYPALRRLEQQGLLKGRWRKSDSGRRRRYYALTKKGRRALEGERTAWLSVHRTLTRAWEAEPCPT